MTFSQDVIKQDMQEFIYPIFKYLTDVPFNFWFYLWLLAVPVLVFAGKLEHSSRRRVLILLIAGLVSYVMFFLSVHTMSEIGYREYHDCQESGPYEWGSHLAHESCKKSLFDPKFGPMLLGWIPGFGYVGLWHWLWRRRHEIKLSEISNNEHERFLSILYFGAFVFLSIIFAATLLWVLSLFIEKWWII